MANSKRRLCEWPFQKVVFNKNISVKDPAPIPKKGFSLISVIALL